MSALLQQHCRPREGEGALTRAAAEQLLAEVPGWELNEAASEISRTYRFQDYHQTIAFVNALAWVVHREDHHPDLEIGYNRCRVRFSTHSVRGLSENDFICAAKINAQYAA
jgi:4a-hydroxytetrahydrobiopterin dehydratase